VRAGIRFLLGFEERRIDAVDPTLTVLDWLRRVEHRVGTKEGCNEGDCGACTVLVGRPVGARMRYAAVNACIRFVPTLDGCQLLTVEDLRAPDGALHPVQQALVEHHGSQCGFCTPGFVMTMAALQRAEPRRDRQTVNDWLAGNLCRCTGYGPIVAAAMSLAVEPTDHLAAREAETVRRLRALPQDAYVVGQGERRLWSPTSAAELAAILLEQPDATILAGATDVGLWVTKQQRRLDRIVWIGRCADLARIEETAAAIEIGAAATYSAAFDAIARHYPDGGELLRRLGAVQVRNAGTIGGNIANGSPVGDSPPLLIAAGATLHLRRGAERRALPLEAFFLDYGRQDRRPGEFVERITLPKPQPGASLRAYKITKRFDQDIAAVCAAFLIRRDHGQVVEARIAMGGMAATPRRAPHAEAALVGQPWARPTVERAMAALGQDFRPITDWRASAAYRLAVARNLLLKCYLEDERPLRLARAAEVADAA
jgi:xanthine dehydrogenase small subunit